MDILHHNTFVKEIVRTQNHTLCSRLPHQHHDTLDKTDYNIINLVL